MRQQAEAALAQSERSYREIFDSPTDAIFIQDAKTGCVVDVNNAALDMYACTKEELLGKTVKDISAEVPPYDETNAEEKIRKAVEEGPQIFEWQAKKKNGELFWVEVNLKFSKIGDKERVLAVVRDIDERKRSQELLVQSEKMMSVGGLAAGMAHEINNPLAGIMQSAEVLQMRLSNKTHAANERAAHEAGTSMAAVDAFMESRGVHNTLKNIQDSVERASKIVSNVLSFARKNDAEHTPQSIEDLLEQTLHIAGSDYDLKKQYDFRNIDIMREYGSELPAVACDPSKIQQVFLNVLRNAAESIQDGNLRESSPRITLRLAHQPAEKSMRIEIEDNGPGMDEATRKRVFEPFFTTKPPDRGTGLGLSVSYFIVTEHHGAGCGLNPCREKEPSSSSIYRAIPPLDTSYGFRYNNSQ